MPTLALIIEYDGTNYAGWQRQLNAVSVQSKIEKALFDITGLNLNLTGAGRTDAGVHASGQVAHSVIEDDMLNHFTIPEDKIAIALNSNLPIDIRIKNAKIFETPFHARYDAIAREYSYSFHTEESVFLNRFSAYFRYKLNFDELYASASVFTGRHDFTTFSKFNPEIKNNFCTIEKCEWKRISDYQFNLKIKANRFLYGMVRSLVGVMIDISRGKREIEEVKNALEKCDRSLCSQLAPANGLVLNRIYYPENISDYFMQS
ncbi:MAG: tRNA pseudouridine(38-40) synthase TruA [Bacteroidota bacterium]|jgi:tRNA pseudouridine38-40 synthase